MIARHFFRSSAKLFEAVSSSRSAARAENITIPAEGEADQPLTPADEGAAAEAAGLDYHHIPVSLDDLDSTQVARLQAAITASPGPVFVHCGAGQRACALTLLATRGEAAAGSGRELAAKAAELGFPVTDPRLARFLEEEADAMGPGGAESR